MLFTGSGPYVVIDRRTNSETGARESSSDDGNYAVLFTVGTNSTYLHTRCTLPPENGYHPPHTATP